jgi:hypothetical protein
MPYISGILFVYPNIHPLRVVHGMIWRELLSADISTVYRNRLRIMPWPSGQSVRCKVHILNTPKMNLRSYLS